MYYLGVDIGGTKIAVSLADENCRILETVTHSTPATPDFSGELGLVTKSADILLRARGESRFALLAVGVSCPGPLDLSSGKILHVATTGWRDIPVKRLFHETFGVPVVLENDANAACYAEALCGAGKGYETVVYLTVSTGIGGGVCIEKKLMHGAHGFAAEFGHISVVPDGPPCPCGGRGCVQLYASGTAMAYRAREATREIASMLGGYTDITAREIEAGVRAGDPLSISIWNDAIEKLGILIAMLSQALDPDIFVFGGGVSNAWDLMEPILRTEAAHYCCSDIFTYLNLQKAQLGGMIGTTGAVLLAHRLIQKI
ncbi:ROK family protein [Anaerotruncus rubiinfantis]|uniref:ROK family protein n=1 Tax=Anaerotruncus rubiinfantis TaxID=1720200 RepID=UPI0034A3EC8A